MIRNRLESMASEEGKTLGGEPHSTGYPRGNHIDLNHEVRI